MISLIKAILILLAIASPACSLVINCKFFMSTEYSCEVTGVQSPGVPDVTQITGNHLSGRSNIDVKALTTGNRNYFTMIPKNLEKFFPKLEYLDLINNKITSVTSAELARWPNLRHFDVGNNRVEVVLGDLFKHTPKISYVSFHGNLIRQVEDTLLNNLGALKYLNFNANPCISAMGTTPQQITNVKNLLTKQCPCTGLCLIRREVDNLKARADIEIGSFGALDDAVKANAKEIANLKAASQKQDQKIEDQKRLAEEQAKSIKELTSLSSELKAFTSDLQATVRSQQQTIDAQARSINDLKATVDSQNSAIQGQDQKIIQQGSLLNEQGRRITNIEMSLRELESNPCTCNQP